MTKIQWTEKTWNPITGCSKVSPGCAHCYAEGVAKRFWGDRAFGDVQFHPERLEQPLKVKKPTMWFVNSMSDLFHEVVTDEQLDQIFAVMELAQWHTFQILTKRPQRMSKYFAGSPEPRILRQAIALAEGSSRLSLQITRGLPLPNVWLGVTCENQKTANDRIPLLLQTPAAVRFLSCEPLLEKINLAQAHVNLINVMPEQQKQAMTAQLVKGEKPLLPKIDWVICGGESGAKARYFDLDWARSLRDQCAAAGVPFFLKQLGNNHGDRLKMIGNHGVTLKYGTGKSGDIEQFPQDLQIRQFPKFESLVGAK